MSRRNRGRGPRTPTEVERRVFMAHGWFGLGRLVIMWAGSIGLAWVGIYLPIKASAGKIAFIDLIYDLAVKTGLGHKVSLGINLALILLVIWQRRSYQRRLQHLGRRTEQLELQLDPGRSSSNPRILTPKP